MDAPTSNAALHRSGRGRVFNSIIDAIGDTPIVRLNKLPKMHGAGATILAKLEYFNPAASVKDRIGAAMGAAMTINGHTISDVSAARERVHAQVKERFPDPQDACDSYAANLTPAQ